MCIAQLIFKSLFTVIILYIQYIVNLFILYVFQLQYVERNQIVSKSFSSNSLIHHRVHRYKFIKNHSIYKIDI